MLDTEDGVIMTEELSSKLYEHLINQTIVITYSSSLKYIKFILADW